MIRPTHTRSQPCYLTATAICCVNGITNLFHTAFPTSTWFILTGVFFLFALFQRCPCNDKDRPTTSDRDPT